MKKSLPIPHILLRYALGVGFVVPVLDRIGLLSAPGNADVTRGSWTNFVGYSNTLTPYLSQKTASFFGLVASICEAVVGTLLINGYKIKFAALGSFALTLIFALSMLLFTGYRSPFNYSVFVVSFASLLLVAQETKEKQGNHSNSI